eukprot:Em0022g934a
MTEAAGLYWMGVAAERSGDMQGATMYYKKAVQLEPDIESHVTSGDHHDTGDYSEKGTALQTIETTSLSNLLESFHHLSLTTYCTPEKDSKSTHISVLPVDVVQYILRWVVTEQVDMRSLEHFSMVCRGFYLLSRDPQLWRMACRKIWGDCSCAAYCGGWREMFISRPHLYFNGIYISKTSYIRSGERSLDTFYKPYHSVVYYRYLRFFPDGSVIGHYTSVEDNVSVVVRSSVVHEQSGHKHGRRPHHEALYEHTFHMELELKSSHFHQHFNKLNWKEHFCHILHKPSGTVQLDRFTIDYKYTPFHFSPVKSYTVNCHRPL